MRRSMVGAAVLILATAASGSVFERFLSPERPADRAIMNYLELAKSGRASSMDLANLGVLIFEKGFPGDAEDYLKAALKLDKHNYEAAYRLGLVLQREGRDREAVRYYKMTLKQRRGYAEARFMLAMAEERCGRREAAIRDYAKAYRYAPQLADPKRNPLVYDSHLQTEAVLRHYQESAGTSTLPVTEIDPAAVRRMMAARPEAAPAPPPPAATATVTPASAPAPAAPVRRPAPQPVGRALPGGLGAAVPPPATPGPTPTPTR
ncbi:MAG: tetratricopeptide repeat protein [Thermoanaerobaculaceae bacterium]|nr:tetratricopeptide repeat protein [Thermoanaerobaculaceae bacterium]TAM48521.1 MAG: tetratricopeptide repeat protein [Acidobacteriota bacterium]